MRSPLTHLRSATVAALVLALGACASPAPAGTGSGPAIAVLGTENFYADLLAQIGGSRVGASSIVNDPNADPHEYEASPAAAKQVADAKLVIVNGIGYDDFMDRLIGASTKPDRIVINVQDLLGVKDDVNVHVWYDPATMPKVADAATDALSKLDRFTETGANLGSLGVLEAKFLIRLMQANARMFDKFGA